MNFQANRRLVSHDHLFSYQQCARNFQADHEFTHVRNKVHLLALLSQGREPKNAAKTI